MTSYMMQHMEVRENLLTDPKYLYLFSVERVNALVLSGTPFRDAYKQVAKEIEDDTFSAPTQLNHTHEGSIGNLSTEKIRAAMEKNLVDFHFEDKNQAIKELLA